MTLQYSRLAILPLLYGALTIIFLTNTNSLTNVDTPLILLSQFNVFVLSFICFLKLRRSTSFIFVLTPLVYCIFFLLILFSNQSDFREYEASDSFVYDYLATLLNKPNGIETALQQNYDIDDMGYPIIRNIFSAYAGSNIGLFFFKFFLHYVTAYLVTLISRKFMTIDLSNKVGLFYLNCSVALLFVMSGLKETIFTFLTVLSIFGFQRSFIFGMLTAILTFFFRELYPILLLTSYILLKNNIRLSLIALPFLIALLLLYLVLNSNSLDSYYLVFLYFYDEILIIAALVGGLLGGLVTIDPSDITNFIYSPTVFMLNFLIIQRFFSDGFKSTQSQVFLLLLIFVFPLIVLGQGLKVRYLAPFYFLYIMFGFRSFKEPSAYNFILSVASCTTLFIAWNILSN